MFDPDDLAAHGDMERKRKREDAMFPKTSPFIYLLNAMEAAAQASNPALEEYGIKRRKVLEYVERLEAAQPEAAPTSGGWWPVGYIDNAGCVVWEPGRDPGNLIPGQLVYVSHRRTPQKDE